MKIAIEHSKHLRPHKLRVGDRVYQRVNPWHAGTVTRADSHGFTITYDGHGRRGGEPRMRASFPFSRGWDFLVGNASPELLHEAQAPAN